MSVEDVKKELVELINTLSEKELEVLLTILKERQIGAPTNELLKKFNEITDRDDWVFQELAK